MYNNKLKFYSLKGGMVKIVEDDAIIFAKFMEFDYTAFTPENVWGMRIRGFVLSEDGGNTFQVKGDYEQLMDFDTNEFEIEDSSEEFLKLKKTNGDTYTFFKEGCGLDQIPEEMRTLKTRF